MISLLLHILAATLGAAIVVYAIGTCLVWAGGAATYLRRRR